MIHHQHIAQKNPVAIWLKIILVSFLSATKGPGYQLLPPSELLSKGIVPGQCPVSFPTAEPSIPSSRRFPPPLLLHLFGWADRLHLIWTWRVDSRDFSRDKKTKRGWRNLIRHLHLVWKLLSILVPIVVVDFFDVALQFQHQRFCIRKFNARTCWDLWANAALICTCIYIYTALSFHSDRSRPRL